MSSLILSQPRRCSDRRIRRRAVKSVFIHAPQKCPNKHWLSTREFCKTWGISEHTARKWREAWLRTGYHNSPQPRNYSCNGDPEYRYYYDEVMGLPEGTWLARFKAKQKADFAAPNKSNKETSA
jgi:hypothetical protein